jgi:putative endonuclease
MDDDLTRCGAGPPRERSDRGRRAERLGRRGERAAARVLRRAGYVVLGHRVRTPAGEVDLVALDGETLALVEVKAARGGPGEAEPAETVSAPGPERRVDHAKRRRLALAARFLARSRGLSGRPVRFDVVVVRLEGWRARCTILRQAFRGSGR